MTDITSWPSAFAAAQSNVTQQPCASVRQGSVQCHSTNSTVYCCAFTSLQANFLHVSAHWKLENCFHTNTVPMNDHCFNTWLFLVWTLPFVVSYIVSNNLYTQVREESFLECTEKSTEPHAYSFNTIQTYTRAVAEVCNVTYRGPKYSTNSNTMYTCSCVSWAACVYTGLTRAKTNKLKKN